MKNFLVTIFNAVVLIIIGYTATAFREAEQLNCSCNRSDFIYTCFSSQKSKIQPLLISP